MVSLGNKKTQQPDHMLAFKLKKITMEEGYPDLFMGLNKKKSSAIKEGSFMGLDRQVRMQFSAHTNIKLIRMGAMN